VTCFRSFRSKRFPSLPRTWVVRVSCYGAGVRELGKNFSAHGDIQRRVCPCQRVCAEKQIGPPPVQAEFSATWISAHDGSRGRLPASRAP
jgi:hypothetical protein